MLHHPIRPRPTQACRRLHFHSTMTLLRDLASRFPQYRSSRVHNYGRGSLLPSLSPGRSGQSFLLVIYLPAQPVRYFPLVLQSEASAVICGIVMIRASSPIHKSQMMPPEA